MKNITEPIFSDHFAIIRVSKRNVFLSPSNQDAKTLLVIKKGVYERARKRSDIKSIRNPILLTVCEGGYERARKRKSNEATNSKEKYNTAYRIVILTVNEWEHIEEVPVVYAITKIYRQEQKSRFVRKYPVRGIAKIWQAQQCRNADITAALWQEQEQSRNGK
jgi:hypothetical protein